MTPQNIPCPACEGPTTDGLLCSDCTRRVRIALETLPWLLGELNTQIRRQNQAGTGVGRSSGNPLPYDEESTKARDYVIRNLSEMVLELDMGDTRNLGQNPRAWAHWLLSRIPRIRGHRNVKDITAEITGWRSIILRRIDQPERLLVGQCAICEQAVFAHPRQEKVQCRRCLEVAEKHGGGYVPEYVVADEREGLRQWVREQLVPLSDLDAVADMFRRESPNPKTLRSWVRRKQLEVRSQVAGVDLFSVKQFLELVDRLPTRKAAG